MRPFAPPYTGAMRRPHDPLRLDVVAFTTEGGSLSGQWDGAELARLAESQSPPQDTALSPVDWQASGERRVVSGGPPQPWIALSVASRLWLTCQRCLQPFEWPGQVSGQVRFVRGEAEAETLDAEIDDDVLAITRSLNLRELLEDELLLAMPLIPRHELCPQPLAVAPGATDPADGADAPAHPFAALQALKGGAGGAGGAGGQPGSS